MQNPASAIAAAAIAVLLPSIPTAAAQTAQLPPPLPISSLDLQMIQDAWTNPDDNKHGDQDRPGYKLLQHSWDTIHTIRARVATSVSIRLDPAEQISTFLVADPALVEATLVSPNGVELRALQAGADTSLSIYTAAGRLYKLYTRTVPHDAPTTTDFLVDIRLTQPRRVPARHSAAGPHPAARTNAQVLHTVPAPQPAALPRSLYRAPGPDSPATATPQGVFENLESHGATISALRYDLTAHANTHAAKAAIGPQRVFRDNRWTYIDFGTLAATMDRWPAATLLTAETESPVATRIAGPQRQILIVEAIGSIVLRSGPHVICIDLARPPGQGPPPQPPRPTAPALALQQPSALPEAPEHEAIVTTLKARDPDTLTRVLLPAISGTDGATYTHLDETTVLLNGLSWPDAIALCARLSTHAVSCTFERPGA